jgi:hypothetical protein
MATTTLLGSLRLLELPLVASALFLQGCPLSDDYYIDSNHQAAERGGTMGVGGTLATGGSGGKATECPDCPPGCHRERQDEKDYLFCATDTIYSVAEATCEGAGMSLVIVDDPMEDDWVWKTLDRWYSGVQPFVFIGADDRRDEGKWLLADGVEFWNGEADGDVVGDRYVHWGAQQPNDLSPVTQTQEDCGAIVLVDGSWGDVRCELDCPFVCEER